MADKKEGFHNRFQKALAVVEKGNMACNTVNNIKTISKGISQRLTELHAQSHSSQTNPFETFMQAPLCSQSEKRQQMLIELSQTQCDIAARTRDIAAQEGQGKLIDYSTVTNATSVSNFAPSIILSGAMVLNAACTLIDGYLTRRTLREGFDRLDVTVQTGFNNLSNALKNGFERLDARFSWGFSELMWRVEEQTKATQETNKILIEWLDVRAQELRKKGIDCYNFGWFDQALSFFLEAMEKAKVDYVVAQYLGNIYLFHKQDFENAILYYGQAATFSEPYSSAHRIIALMHQALAYYLADNENKQKDWEAAANCVKKALDIEPGNLEFSYAYAQYSALAGNSNIAIPILNKLIRTDVKYIVKTLSEPDFVIIHDEISKLISDYANEVSLSFVNFLNSLKEKIMPVLDWWENTLLYGIEYTIPSSMLDNQRSALKVNAPSGWQVSGKKIRSLDSSNADKLQTIIEAIEQISNIYQRGDIFSLIKASELLSQIKTPSIECKNGVIRFQFQDVYYNWDCTKNYKEKESSVQFEYYGIGDINI